MRTTSDFAAAIPAAPKPICYHDLGSGWVQRSLTAVQLIVWHANIGTISLSKWSCLFESDTAAALFLVELGTNGRSLQPALRDGLIAFSTSYQGATQAASIETYAEAADLLSEARLAYCALRE